MTSEEFGKQMTSLIVDWAAPTIAKEISDTLKIEPDAKQEATLIKKLSAISAVLVGKTMDMLAEVEGIYALEEEPLAKGGIAKSACDSDELIEFYVSLGDKEE